MPPKIKAKLKLKIKPKLKAKPTTASDKIRGLLVSAGLGDALGVPFEMRQSAKMYTYTGILENRGHIFRRFSKPCHLYLSVGQISDDTEMMLIIAQSLHKYRGKYNRNDVIMRYLAWANHKTTFAMGRNTRALFKNIKTIGGYEGRLRKIEDHESLQSNGALMRSAVLALLDEETALIDCSITNPSTIAIDTNRVYLHMVRQALNDVSKEDILDEIFEKAETKEVFNTVTDASTDTEARDVTESKGWCLHGLYCAIYCFKNFSNVREALDFTIGLEGDTDTNACIVGGLMGAYYGYSSLLEDEVTKANVELLLSVDTNDSDFVRPEEYTMGQALALADSLIEDFI